MAVFAWTPSTIKMHNGYFVPVHYRISLCRLTLHQTQKWSVALHVLVTRRLSLFPPPSPSVPIPRNNLQYLQSIFPQLKSILWPCSSSVCAYWCRAHAQTCTSNATPLGQPGMHATSTNLRKCHKCACAQWRCTHCAAVILVKVMILTFEDLFRLTYRRRECDVVNKRATAISEVYFVNFMNIYPCTFFNQGQTLITVTL